MKVAGISCITNVAGTKGGHEDVLGGAAEAVASLRDVLAGVVRQLE
jgi:hypothetical protein